MINSISYKLTKQPNTISEEIFEPNKKLIDFIENRENKDSRILVIQASNSSGKSFLLNSIAYAFNALDLSNDNLSPTLRRSINYLIDADHQIIDFNIDIYDPDGFNIISSYNNVGENEIYCIDANGSKTIMNDSDFVEKYKLLYDIPEKPLERIYKLLKSIKEFNSQILNQLNPLDLKMISILRSIKDERDEVVISKIKDRLTKNKEIVSTYEAKSLDLKNKLKNLENHRDILRLKRSLENLNNTTENYKKVSSEFEKLTPPSKEKIEVKNNSTINNLKNDIRQLRIPNLLNICKEEIEENEYSNQLFESFSRTDKKVFSILFDNTESIVDNLYSYDVEKINSLLRALDSFRNITLNSSFNELKQGLNESDFKLIKSLKADFDRYKKFSDGNEIINDLFNKNIDTILNEISSLENKYSEILKINSLNKEIFGTIDGIKSKIDKGFKLSKILYKEEHKLNKIPKQKNTYLKTLEKKNNLRFSINKETQEVKTFRDKLLANGMVLENLCDLDVIQLSIDNLVRKNWHYNGIEKEKIEEFKSEIKKLNSLTLQIEKDISNDEVKFNVENSKQPSSYSKHQDKIQLFSNKLSFFTKYLNQKNALINEDGELNPSNNLEDKSYMKIIGEFVASLMGRKIIYQNNTVDIDYIDYSSTTPYFVTPENKRIAFSDFSGGQGSSNYLKAKLNLNEERKYIVLIDEIANMDNQSLEIVLNRLKELDKNNKLLLAILVEPSKEKNVFEIKAY